MRACLLPLCALAMAACGSGAGGTALDAGDGPITPRDTAPAEAAPQVDATADAPASDAAVQTDAAVDGTLADGAPADGPPVELCTTGSFQAYQGNLHAHTSYSDGEQTPADAFAYARDVAHLDIMVVTDHVEQLYLLPPLNRWGECQSQADAAYAPGTYLAACGFEYGSGFSGITSIGHNNVFFSPSLFPAVQTDFHAFYGSLVACPTCIGQFNHPGDGQDYNWNGFEYHADVDERMTLFEFNSDPAWDLFFAALDRGWHVSPMYNQDNHGADWGTANGHRSGFWMTALSREALYEAMLHRRTFATSDATATIKLVTDAGCWMGSAIVGTTVTFTVEAADADAADAFTAIDVYGPGQTLRESHDCGGASSCTATFTLPVAAYLVARATQADGDFLVAAPLWGPAP